MFDGRLYSKGRIENPKARKLHTNIVEYLNKKYPFDIVSNCNLLKIRGDTAIVYLNKKFLYDPKKYQKYNISGSNGNYFFKIVGLDEFK